MELIIVADSPSSCQTGDADGDRDVRIADRLGKSVTTNIKCFPKIRLRVPFTSGNGTMSVKIEV